MRLRQCSTSRHGCSTKLIDDLFHWRKAGVGCMFILMPPLLSINPRNTRQYGVTLVSTCEAQAEMPREGSERGAGGLLVLHRWAAESRATRRSSTRMHGPGWSERWTAAVPRWKHVGCTGGWTGTGCGQTGFPRAQDNAEDPQAGTRRERRLCAGSGVSSERPKARASKKPGSLGAETCRATPGGVQTCRCGRCERLCCRVSGMNRRDRDTGTGYRETGLGQRGCACSLNAASVETRGHTIAGQNRRVLPRGRGNAGARGQ